MRCFAPDYHVSCITSVSLNDLAERKVKLILLDRDNTLAKPLTKELAPSVLAWIEQAKSQGFSLCILSNNLHGSFIAKTARDLGIDYLHASFKPLPFSVRKVCEKYGIAPSQACLIGDQVFTDVMAAKLSGVHSILVNPLTNDEPIWSSLIRHVGRHLAGIHERTHR